MKSLKKILSRSGESLVEVLASILILTCSMMILAAGLSGAQKVAAAIKLEDTVFTLSGSEKEALVKLNDYEIGDLQGHLSESGFYYYG